LRIDSHQHFEGDYSPELLLPILKRNRFEGTVWVGGDSSSLEIAARHEFIRAVIVAVDLNAPDLPYTLDRLQKDLKFRGVCHVFAHDPLPAGLAELARRNLSLDLPPRPELAAAIAGRFPALRLVLDHVGRPSLMTRPVDEWIRDLDAAAKHPLLAAKISGLITDAPTRWNADQFRPIVREAMRAFGPDRLMFGSDWPSYLPEGTWKESLAAFTQSIGAVPMEIREQLLGGTAARFYRIDTGPGA
jgi:L-fuconolactonase